jgi:hypothetical protein
LSTHRIEPVVLIDAMSLRPVPDDPSPTVIRDVPWIVATVMILIAAWTLPLALVSDAETRGLVELVVSAVLSVVLLAIVWIPHITITNHEVSVRRLTREFVAPLEDLVGIDSTTSILFRQRVPRLVLLDGTGIPLPVRGFTWSGTPRVYRDAIAEIRTRAAVLGNEIAIVV